LHNIVRSVQHYFLHSPRNIAGTLKSTGAAHASLQASLYSLALFALSLVLAVAVFWIFIATALASPNTASSQLLEYAVSAIMISPFLLGIAADTAALLLALLAVLRRAERPLTIAAALLVSGYLLAAYTIALVGPILLAVLAD
jgi:hypothetical protein